MPWIPLRTMGAKFGYKYGNIYPYIRYPWGKMNARVGFLLKMNARLGHSFSVDKCRLNKAIRSILPHPALISMILRSCLLCLICWEEPYLYVLTTLRTVEFCHFCTKFPLCSLLLFDGCNAPINLLLAFHGIAIKCRCGLACCLPLKNGVSLFISHRSTLAQLSSNGYFLCSLLIYIVLSAPMLFLLPPLALVHHWY